MIGSQNVGAQRFNSQFLSPKRNDIAENKVKYKADNQGSQHIRQEINCLNCVFEFDFCIQTTGKGKTQNVYQNCGAQRKFNGKGIGLSHGRVFEKLNVVPKSYGIPDTIPFPVGKAVENTLQKRYGMENKEQNHKRNHHEIKRFVDSGFLSVFFLHSSTS